MKQERKKYINYYLVWELGKKKRSVKRWESGLKEREKGLKEKEEKGGGREGRKYESWGKKKREKRFRKMWKRKMKHTSGADHSESMNSSESNAGGREPYVMECVNKYNEEENNEQRRRRRRK